MSVSLSPQISLDFLIIGVTVLLRNLWEQLPTNGTRHSFLWLWLMAYLQLAEEGSELPTSGPTASVLTRRKTHLKSPLSISLSSMQDINIIAPWSDSNLQSDVQNANRLPPEPFSVSNFLNVMTYHWNAYKKINRQWERRTENSTEIQKKKHLFSLTATKVSQEMRVIQLTFWRDKSESGGRCNKIQKRVYQTISMKCPFDDLYFIAGAKISDYQCLWTKKRDDSSE